MLFRSITINPPLDVRLCLKLSADCATDLVYTIQQMPSILLRGRTVSSLVENIYFTSISEPFGPRNASPFGLAFVSDRRNHTLVYVYRLWKNLSLGLI